MSSTVEPLYSFQKAAIDEIVGGKQIYLGFDPGLGKSRTALEAAEKRGAVNVLITCHASGRYVWREQVRLWTKYPVTIVQTPADLYRPGVKVLTYGLISQVKSPFVKTIAAASGIQFDFTILDEAAALKNSGSNRTMAVFGPMLPKLGYVLPLSGTPAPNHAGELFPVLKALYPKALKDGSGKVLNQWQFEDQYCRVVLKRFGTGHPVRVIQGSRNLNMLRQKIDGFMVRVRKEDVLKDLPPVRYDVVPLGVQAPALPTEASLERMDDNELLAYLAGKVGDDHLMKLRRMLGICKTAPALDYLNDFLANVSASKKILVFAHHREVIEHLFKELAAWNPVVISGASSPASRDAAVTSFLTEDRCRVFIGNIQAAGTGLTLVGPKCDCSDVFFVEASYSASDNVQAAARVHRIGQREAVVARFLTAHGTLDDRIQQILARKARDFAGLFG